MKKISLFLTVLVFSILFFQSIVIAESLKQLTVHFIDVGQGDASFIELPDGKNILIDTGSPAAGPNLVKYLESLHITKINHLILTHPHDDHIGGIFSLLSVFEIDTLYDNGFSNFGSTVYFEYATAVRKNLSKYRILQAGESLTFHDTGIDVLNPLLPPTGNLNNDSIVLRLKYKDIRIMFAGDVSTPGELRLLKVSSDLESQVMKAAHHGANDTLSEEFLGAVRPETVILSAALINRYARPHEGTIKRLSENNIKTFRTDLHGHIVLKSDGKTFSIATEK